MNQHRYIDLTGQRFSKLTVLSFAFVDIDRREAYFNVKCDCGIEFIAKGYFLRKGYTRSCGCLRIENNKHKHIA